MHGEAASRYRGAANRYPHRLPTPAVPSAPWHSVGRHHLLPEAATEERDTRESRESGAASGRQEVPRDRFSQVSRDPIRPPSRRWEAPGGPGSPSARSRAVKRFPCAWAALPLAAAPRVGRAASRCGAEWPPAAPFPTDEARRSLSWISPPVPTSVSPPLRSSKPTSSGSRRPPRSGVGNPRQEWIRLRPSCGE